MLNHPLPSLRATLAVLCLLAAGLANAAPATYLKLSNIDGVNTTVPYAGWSEVQNVSFSLSRSVLPRGGGDFDVGKPLITGLGWTQTVDTTLPPLLGLMVQGKAIPEARFQFVADGPGGLATVAQVRLTEAYVTGLTLNGGHFSGELSSDQFGMGYKPFGGKGELLPQRNTGYDFGDAEHRPSLSTPFGGHAYRGAVPGPGGMAGPDSIFVRHNVVAEGGSSRIKGYENWSEVSGMQWSASATFGLGGGGGSNVGKAGAGELIWEQLLDNAAFSGLDSMLRTEEMDELVMEFVRHTQAGPVTFMQLVFRDFHISEWGLHGETIHQALSFSKLVQTVWAIDGKGLRGAPTSIGWDVMENKLMGGVGPTGSPAGFGSGGLTGSVSAIPEPQTALLLGAGLLLVFLRQRRPAQLA